MFWTAHADLAEAAALALIGEADLRGATPPLTASDAVNLAEVATTLSRLTDREVRRVVVEDDEYVRLAVAAGTPAAAAQFLVGMFRAARREEFAVTDPTLRTGSSGNPSPREVLQAAIAA